MINLHSLCAKSAAGLAVLLAAAAAHAQGEPAAPAGGGSTSNCLAPPTLTSDVPNNIALTRQADANCFAWQEFIGLNWEASPTQRGQPDTSVPASKFGDPDNMRATVWETYKESDEVFLKNASDPGPWNAKPARNVKVLGGLHPLSPEPRLDLSSIGQASQGSPWLTAQNKNLTLYERSMNEDEYNYIRANKLYDAKVQQTFAVSPGLSLPDGTPASSAYGTMGSIEIKAAWLELPNKADWQYFKTSYAMVTYPGKAPKKVVVGLTGLHIIHKTALGQQFIWATFEHIRNAPDTEQVANKKFTPPYTYFNASCDPATDYYKCVANADPSKVNGGKNPYDAPIQVVRTTAIPSRANDDVVGLNQFVWSQVIAPQNAKSVFLNYQLVNTLWSNQNTVIQPGARVPLVAAQLSPSIVQEPVANTTMETYVQNLTCLTCHVSAPIAKVKKHSREDLTKIFDPATAGTAATAQNPLASDYSFLLQTASSPILPAAHKGQK
jgi:hypothetical protein